MSVSIDAPRSAQGSRPARWWIVPEVLVLALLGTLLAVGVGRPVDVRAELADRVATLLEQSSPAEHHDHGHQVTAEDKVFCEAEVIATEPPTVTDIADVAKVYATFFCAAGRPGMEFMWSSRASGPAVAELDRNPAVVRVPAAGEGYQQRVRELFPDQYEDRALKINISQEAARELRRRYEEAFPPRA
jgi:hypothetical protein